MTRVRLGEKLQQFVKPNCSRRAWLLAIAASVLATTIRAQDGQPASASGSNGTSTKKVVFPEFSAVERTVAEYFATLKGYKPGDIISHRDVQAVFKALEKIGWKIEDERQFMGLVLADNHFLVQQMRSTNGTKFMQQVSGFGLVYDRLERVIDRPGGRDMLVSLMKLPNAAQFAKQKPAQGDPDFVALLPKDSNGFDQRIKDYDKPTGRIYTQAEFMKRLHDSYLRAQRKALGERR